MLSLTLNGTSIYRLFNPNRYDTKTLKPVNDKEEFGLLMIKFFVDNPMIAPEKVGPIIDYVYNEKYTQDRIIRDENDLFIRHESSSPNFSFKGRNPDTLLRQTEEWHEELNRINRARDRANRTYGTRSYSPPKKWARVNIGNYSASSGGKENKKIYTITQLTTYDELSEEGREMKHCVASYASSCASGSCSIWSLKIAQKGVALKRMVTIELKNNNIAQVRGKCNRKADASENNIIADWASREGLRVSRWC